MSSASLAPTRPAHPDATVAYLIAQAQPALMAPQAAHLGSRFDTYA